MDWLRLWWRQSDHYDRLSSHLQARGMDTLTRVTISVIAGGFGGRRARDDLRAPPDRAALSASPARWPPAVGAAWLRVLWALRWPTRVAAIRFARAVPTPASRCSRWPKAIPSLALLACTTFATMAGYIALFHTAPLMAYNFAIASAIGAVEGGPHGGEIQHRCPPCVPTCSLLLLNLAVPFGVQVVVHVLGADAVRAERDQLTGLLTRRAFHRRAKARLEQGRDQRRSCRHHRDRPGPLQTAQRQLRTQHR